MPGCVSKFAVYRTGGETENGQLRAYIGLVELQGRGAAIAILDRWHEHTARGPAAARWTMAIPSLAKPELLDCAGDQRRALVLELVWTVFVLREFRKDIGLAWHKRVRGACFVRIRPSPEERTLRALLMRDMPADVNTAVAFVESLAGQGQLRLTRHLNGDCFGCGGHHLVRFCPLLPPEERATLPKPAPGNAPQAAPKASPTPPGGKTRRRVRCPGGGGCMAFGPGGRCKVCGCRWEPGNPNRPGQKFGARPCRTCAYPGPAGRTGWLRCTICKRKGYVAKFKRDRCKRCTRPRAGAKCSRCGRKPLHGDH